MQQLSRTYQIALGALLVLLIAWFTVLKPKPLETLPAGAAPVPPAVTDPKAPGQQGLENAVAKAKGAVATSAAATAATQAAGDGTGAPATAAGTTPTANATSGTASGSAARAPRDVTAPILREAARGKVAVLLFFGKGSDDAAVRRALLGIDRHNGRVTVRAVPITRVADYAAITIGADVSQSPTVLAFGADRQARTRVGFTDTRSIDQLVGDVGGPAFAPGGLRGYRARIQAACAVLGTTLTGEALQAPDLQERLAVVRGSLASVRKLKVPRRFKAFHAAFTANLRLTVDAYAAVGAAKAAGQDTAAAFAPFAPRIDASVRRAEAAAQRARFVPGC